MKISPKQSKQSGKVYFKFFLWPSIIISIVLSLLLTLLLNLAF